ncbi:CaiB/BaiF CoA transferase family protein, partial [Chloroflexota bacterium]
MVSGLEGIKIVQTASAMAGPMTARLMADWGADVIWVENPLRGDIVRGNAAVRRGGRAIPSDVDYFMQNHNRNKRGITLDLSKERGREILCKLVESADVFLSNFRTREIEKFKLDYQTLKQLNPKIIYANITGYGKNGPDRNLPGFEHTSYFSRTGLLHTLQTPWSPPPQYTVGSGDYVTGVILAYGIMAALFIRERIGIGQEVDTSLYQAGVFAISGDICGALITGRDRQSIERREIANAVHNAYQTKDARWVRIGMTQPDPYWPQFCKAIEREDLEHDPRFESFDPRIENHYALFDILEEVFMSKTLDEWKVRLNKAGVPWAPIQTLPEVAADPQARANGFYITYDVPDYGPIEM